MKSSNDDYTNTGSTTGTTNAIPPSSSMYDSSSLKNSNKNNNNNMIDNNNHSNNNNNNNNNNTDEENYNNNQLSNDLVLFLSNPTISSGLIDGSLDLRSYSTIVHKELYNIENNCIQYYKEKESDFLIVQNELNECSNILNIIHEMLLGFQADLGNLSNEIRTIQDKSYMLDIQLRNRTNCEKLVRSFLQQITISPSIANTIVYGPINISYINAIQELQTISYKCNHSTTNTGSTSSTSNFTAPSFSEETVPTTEVYKVDDTSTTITTNNNNNNNNNQAITEMKLVLKQLQDIAIKRIRDYFLLQMKLLRSKPQTNIRIVQVHGLLKYSTLYDFLEDYILSNTSNNSTSTNNNNNNTNNNTNVNICILKNEIYDIYCEIMNKILIELFRTYYYQLLQLDCTKTNATRYDVIAIDDTIIRDTITTKAKKRSDILCLNNRFYNCFGISNNNTNNTSTTTTADNNTGSSTGTTIAPTQGGQPSSNSTSSTTNNTIVERGGTINGSNITSSSTTQIGAQATTTVRRRLIPTKQNYQQQLQQHQLREQDVNTSSTDRDNSSDSISTAANNNNNYNNNNAMTTTTAAMTENGRTDPLLVSLQEMTPIIPNVVATATATGIDSNSIKKYPYECLYRSLLGHLVDSITNEHIFCRQFFKLDTFTKLFTTTLSILLEQIENYMFTCYDAICILLMIKITHSYKLILRSRMIYSVDTFLDTITSKLLWPRLKIIIDNHIRSLQTATSISLGTIDLHAHYVSRRMGEFCCSVLLILQTNNNTTTTATGSSTITTTPSRLIPTLTSPYRLSSSSNTAALSNNNNNNQSAGDKLLEDIGQMISSFIILIERLSEVHTVQKKRTVFLINNLDHIVCIFQGRRILPTTSIEFKTFIDLLVKYREMFVEEELLSAGFSKMIAFVQQTEAHIASVQRNNNNNNNNNNIIGLKYDVNQSVVETLVLDFATNWKSNIEIINKNVLSYFSNFRNGMELLKQCLTQLLLYYTRFQDVLRKVYGTTNNQSNQNNFFSRDLVSTNVILAEIKKYALSI